jgi:hypothetical protein
MTPDPNKMQIVNILLRGSSKPLSARRGQADSSLAGTHAVTVQKFAQVRIGLDKAGETLKAPKRLQVAGV